MPHAYRDLILKMAVIALVMPVSLPAAAEDDIVAPSEQTEFEPLPIVMPPPMPTTPNDAPPAPPMMPMISPRAGAGAALPDSAIATPDNPPAAGRQIVVRGFKTPLQPAWATSANEDADLNAAIEIFDHSLTQPASFGDPYQPFRDFLMRHPKCGWNHSILENIEDTAPTAP